MSITASLCFEHDLEKGVVRTPLSYALMTGDENTHEFVITVKRGEADADLTGATVTGYFVRPDGVTVVNEGTIEGNKAKVKLSGNCYQHAGRYNLYIKLTKGDETVTIFWGTGTENMSSTDTVVVDENMIPSVKELLERLEAGISEEQKQEIIEEIKAQLDVSKASVLTIDGVDYTLRTGTEGAEGFLTFVVEEE